ncbi:MAG: cobyric acid synthase [Coriobacteriales bacterium]|nr:cobyric acid synthase [Coriobacteriales bacterium]
MSALPLMVQGTMSGVGKSLLVAGLCKVLAQDGVRVAPFKAQNMALNSAVTADGLELGRAQAMQAQAAGVEPVSAMNPVLLKPTSNMGSQVVVRGRPRATMSAREYFRYRRALVGEVRAAYEELARDYDVVLIEGAGSPVEINLGPDDFVNMGMARLANAPVLLVGDIDRGGVFAQLVGTMMLLGEEERRMVRALVVNKFRGDATLFSTGMDMLRERTGVPVAGLVPVMDVTLDDEDSMAERLGRSTATGTVDVAVVRLPRISNFTDFMALEAAGGVGVRYVSAARELGWPDLIIVPGTKATMADLRWLRASGLELALVRAAHAGVPVLGICGGYQMLGQSICDPEGVEDGGQMAGMGLLPVRTTFVPHKRTTCVRGSFLEVDGVLAGVSGAGVRGYEIHMGTTVREGGRALVRLAAEGEQPREDGCQQANVYGCYLHGLLDERPACEALVGSLLAARGLDARAVHAQDMDDFRQRQYDVLADGLRQSLDLDLIRHILERGLS